jgi:hypothetical protein
MIRRYAIGASLLLLLSVPGCLANEPLVGGVNYTETITDDSGNTRIINWNSWADRLLLAAYKHVSAVERRYGFYKVDCVCIFELTVNKWGSIFFKVLSTNDDSYPAIIAKTFEDLENTKYVKFPKGTRRTELILHEVRAHSTFSQEIRVQPAQGLNEEIPN